MACFVAPAAVAIVTTIAQRVVKKKEEKGETVSAQQHTPTLGKWTKRLRWLNTMLWGGVILLAFEHIWHGEVVPWPPFLTAMQTPEEVGPMFREILTYGLTMTAVILIVWGILVGIAELAERRAGAQGIADGETTEASGGA
jgi:hypothetical protein